MGLLRETSSRERKTFVLYGTLAVLFLVLNLLLFPRPLPPELTLVPSAAAALGDLKAPGLSSGGQFFVLGAWEGYQAADGRLERVQAVRPQAAASGGQTAWYDEAHGQVVVEGPQGVRFTLPGEAYPAWIGGQLFTFDENRLGLKAWDSQGRQRWSRVFTSLITAVDTSGGTTVVGTLDGHVQVFGPQGEPVGGFQPGGSRLPVVYNVALAPQQESVLVLAGVDPKRFLVLEKGGADYRPVFHKPLKETTPWPTPLGYLADGRLAYYQSEEGLAFLNPRSPEAERIVATAGDPVAVTDLGIGGLVAFVERQGDEGRLRVASTSGRSLVSLPLKARDLWMDRKADRLTLGLDQTLLTLRTVIQ